MKKISEYIVAVGNIGQPDFEQYINAKIKEGFQPYGFPCLAAATSDDADNQKRSDFVMMQALVKYGKSK